MNLCPDKTVDLFPSTSDNTGIADWGTRYPESVTNISQDMTGTFVYMKYVFWAKFLQ